MPKVPFSKVLVIQPPLVQLNTAYPSGAYLNSFFKNQGLESKWYDLSIELFNEIFSKTGLEHLFNITFDSAVKMIQDAKNSGQEEVASNLERYLCQKDLWLEWIDFILDLLRDGTAKSTRELCHKFVFSPFSPRGSRMDSYIAGLEHELTIDDARNLAVAAVEDLADYITVVFDPEFSLVRYAESLAVNETSFSEIEKGIDSPVLTGFYQKILERKFNDLETSENSKTLICISIPFAGTFTSALYTARFLKTKFQNKVFITIGGGFVNTELRDCTDKTISNYIDAISYDRGYGSYLALFDNWTEIQSFENTDCGPYYKLALFSKNKISTVKDNDPEYQQKEDHITATNTPDYSDIDFSRYPRMADTTNPMQRLWSDGSWIKAYLAHGCYWHKCAFCDVTLDYVKSYKRAGVESLYKSLAAQCQKHNVYGIHFVDEAMPPAAMKDFACLNLSDKNAISWWGNIRFEKSFTRDDADLMANAGLIGVSGGIEIATGSGLDKISKGTDLESIVSACCAFKEAGILIHAYMIYGYYGETEQDTINSMETLRQFYAAGLLDSCFWHKFVLTRHSRLYSEWQQGMHKDLEPFEPKGAGIFAKNGLHFRNENRLAKFGDGLNAALQSWMAGQGLDKPLSKWFNFKVPFPTVKPDMVEKAIARYEQKRDSLWAMEVNAEKAYWLGGNIICSGDTIMWNYMQESYSTRFAGGTDTQKANSFIHLLRELAPQKKNDQTVKQLNELLQQNPGFAKMLRYLHGRGLVTI
ncbi:MAG: radical SAM protein [Treponema sp.]|nr:radical SAM protein [Treponema sp.]